MKTALASAMQMVANAEGPVAPSSSSAPLARLTNPDATVQDLGTVGRGKARITLQAIPVPVAAEPGNARVAAPVTAATVSKRSLEALMGGASGGVTSFGFGAGASSAGLPKAPDASAKRVKPDSTS